MLNGFMQSVIRLGVMAQQPIYEPFCNYNVASNQVDQSYPLIFNLFYPNHYNHHQFNLTFLVTKYLVTVFTILVSAVKLNGVMLSVVRIRVVVPSLETTSYLGTIFSTRGIKLINHIL
jgi:hypothetical protein